MKLMTLNTHSLVESSYEEKKENFYSQYSLQERIKINTEDLTNDNEKNNNMSNKTIQKM